MASIFDPSKESSGEYFKQLFWEQAYLIPFPVFAEAALPNLGIFKGLEAK